MREDSKLDPHVARPFPCFLLLMFLPAMLVPFLARTPAPLLHASTTILPAEENFQSVVDGFTSFHKAFMAKHGGGGGGGPASWRARL